MPTNIGKAGEQAFAHKLRGSKYLVEDLTGNPAYFSKDIDFLVINPETGNRRTYEVKSDSRISQTGNLFIETWNQHSLEQKGWYKFCEADYNRLAAFRNNALTSHSEMVDIGISLVQTDAAAMTQSSSQAKTAITLGRLYRKEKHVYPYSSFVIQGMLYHCTEMQEFKWLEQQIVNPISERDELYESCLWETLGVLFQGSSLKEAANDLHIHISTLRYRIQKIKDLTGFDYLTPYGNFVLHTAYLIWLDKQS